MKAGYVLSGLCAAVLIISSIASAGPSANRLKDGSGLLGDLLGINNKQVQESQPQATPDAPQTAPKQTASAVYDGIWKDANGITLLIKQIHRTLYVSGSSRYSAWQAQCVMANTSAKCMGNGISNTAGEFRYESDLHLGSINLQSSWIRSYSNGHRQSSQTTFNYN